MLGEEVAELVHDQKPAGCYSVQFNIKSADGGLASGVYVYTLQPTNSTHRRRCC
ncbi:MAG: hypothetical protein K9I99_16135 [Melioribacteraceae bacterium]|nr:hypothetical protein [Melioribacteraceae bacterium]